MLTSRDSCSMICVMARVKRNTRLPAADTSTTGPSPLAVTTVFGGTRTDSVVVIVVIAVASSRDSSKSRNALVLSLQFATKNPQSKLFRSFRWMRRGEVAATRLLRRLEFHQFDTAEVRIENVKLPLAVSTHLRVLAAVRLPAMQLQQGLRFRHIGDAE